MQDEDQLVTVLPIHYSNALSPNVQILQYPLMTRPLEIPPSAAASGKRIKARLKPSVRRLEVHIPVDTRPEVWNKEKASDLGAARLEDDKEKNQETNTVGKMKQEESDRSRLSEVRMRSEEIPQAGSYMLGVIRDGTRLYLHRCINFLNTSVGRLHLHPISETHQLRPTLTYMDYMSKKNKRSRGGPGSDSDSDDGPPPDPDEVAPEPLPKKEKKPAGEAKEVQVSVRKSTADDKNIQGGLSVQRRELLSHIRAEEDEKWDDLVYYDGTASICCNFLFLLVYVHVLCFVV
jgi:DNA-directed RNA polymerase III subunit RPC5